MALLSVFLFFSVLAAGGAMAKVPAKDTFKYVNEGEFGPFITEYDASYRATPLFGSPYQLMWYNTTPGEFYLGLRMGLRRSESLFRWVWDANRGKPVGENATLSFGVDGNLVLAEADGRVVWSTGTANKGVVGIRIIPIAGNIVLYDKNGKFVWQSFDYPTDTLLPGQSLRLTGPSKLVSRKSDKENSEGMYSFVLEPKGIALYMAASPKPLPYFNYLGAPFGRLAYQQPTNLTFLPESESEENFRWELKLVSNNGADNLAQVNYNASISILRIQSNGNVEAFTYYEPVDIQAWEKTFSFFSDDGGILEGCDLPSKCGSLGLCKNDMCVACPTAKGLLGWSESCAPPKITSCKGGSDYVKVVGAEHFLTKFVRGQTRKFEDCKSRCSADCKCLGFFFWEKESTCWLAPTLGTLNQVSNTTHVAYIKSS
ncbi:EP1-like glycoprotein 1 [Wolffia australiana]